MSNVLELSESNFDEYVLRSDVPVLVDFWSPSCGPCRMIAPILNDLAEEYDDEVHIFKVNVTSEAGIGAKYGVDMLPTLLFFNGGKVVERMVGAQSKDRIKRAFDEIEE
ncbi:MAG: thioredoxin [Thermoguttaceae bacterium]